MHHWRVILLCAWALWTAHVLKDEPYSDSHLIWEFGGWYEGKSTCETTGEGIKARLMAELTKPEVVQTTVLGVTMKCLPVGVNPQHELRIIYPR